VQDARPHTCTAGGAQKSLIVGVSGSAVAFMWSLMSFGQQRTEPGWGTMGRAANHS